MATSPVSTADVGDRHRRRFALAFLVYALSHVVGMAQTFVPAETARILEWIADGTTLLAVVMVFQVALWKTRRLLPEERHLYFESTGFVAESMRRAQMISWGTVVLVLVFLLPVEKRLDLPVRFYLQGLLVIALTVYSVAFFVLDRDAGDDDAVPDA